MKSKRIFILLIVVLLFPTHALLSDAKYDLTILGTVKYRDSLGRFPIALTKLLKDDLSINYICSLSAEYDEVPSEVRIILDNPDKTPGKVALLFDILWDINRTPANLVPHQSLIKIAYSMLESTAIPPQWVSLLNEKFDLVVIPDAFYYDVYLSSGVTIPIFVFPMG